MNAPSDAPPSHNTTAPAPLRDRLAGRAIALVGLMGSGKTTVGRRLATQLGLPFKDADAEIETAAGRSVSDIFSELGEPEFRAGEHRVIARLVADGAAVIATGGGAFMHEGTRELLMQRAIVVWLKTDLEILARRVARRDTRPLLRGKDPLAVLSAQAEVRYPHYEQAHIVVEAPDSAHDHVVDRILRALEDRLP